MSCSNMRPDGCISLKTHDTVNLGFVEVKEAKYKNDLAKVNKDLYKLGLFAKNSIEKNNLKGALGILVAGKF